MKKNIALLVVFSLLVGGGVWYYKYTQSPEYSFGIIKEAIATHDVALFNRYVDTETLVTSIIDQSLEESRRKNPAPNKLAEGFANMLKGSFSKMGKEQILKFVENGSFENNEIKEGVPKYNIGELYKKINTSETKIEGVAYSQVEGKIAKVGLNIKPAKSDSIITLDIKLRDTGENWQVVEILNMTKLVNSSKKQ